MMNNTISNAVPVVAGRPGHRLVRSGRKIGLALLVFLGAGAGCGQTSFFEVTIAFPPGGTVPCLVSMINSCEVTVSGAANDFFSLAAVACAQLPATSNPIAPFQYGTDKESGNVSFHVEVFDGNLKKLGQGDGGGAIKAGGRQPVTVTIATDPAFQCL